MSTEKKYTPHIHAEVIKAWADGKPIEFRLKGDPTWTTLVARGPAWSAANEYRVKPEEVVDYTIVMHTGTIGATYTKNMSDLLEKGLYPSYKDILQGYCKRTTIDGKVVSLEFIPKDAK